MKRAVENALYLLGGLTVGGGVGFFVTTKILGEKIRTEVADYATQQAAKQFEFESKQKDELLAMKDKEIEELKDKIENPVPKNPPTNSKSSLTDPTFVKTETKNESQVNKYHQVVPSIIAEHYDMTSAEKIIDDALELAEEIKYIPCDYPHISTSMAWNDPTDDEYLVKYRHIVLRYFAKDKVLCVDGTTGMQNSNEDLDDYPEWKIIPDMESVIGRAWLKNVNLDNDGGTQKAIDGTYLYWAVDEAFVINDQMRTHFMINYDSDSYQEWVVDQGRV